MHNSEIYLIVLVIMIVWAQNFVQCSTTKAFSLSRLEFSCNLIPLVAFQWNKRLLQLKFYNLGAHVYRTQLKTTN